MVDFGDLMRLENLYRRLERRMVFGEHEAPRRIAVEAVHRLESGNILLHPQNGLHRFRIVAADDARGLVADEIALVRPQDPNVAPGGNSGGGTRHRRRLLLRAFDHRLR